MSFEQFVQPSLSDLIAYDAELQKKQQEAAQGEKYEQAADFMLDRTAIAAMTQQIIERQNKLTS